MIKLIRDTLLRAEGHRRCDTARGAAGRCRPVGRRQGYLHRERAQRREPARRRGRQGPGKTRKGISASERATRARRVSPRRRASTTKSAGALLDPSTKPMPSRMAFISFSRPIEPQIMHLSCSFDNSGRPKSSRSLPDSRRSVIRPMLPNSSPRGGRMVNQRLAGLLAHERILEGGRNQLLTVFQFGDQPAGVRQHHALEFLVCLRIPE